ncbi:FecR family protein [Sphingomonas sp. ASY06-1R]|uniref:FecR family protein n=1 Tax=Sphingomonas sp. ASY06-1R TaxID=3445771 RepID=UPI003FA3145A
MNHNTTDKIEDEALTWVMRVRDDDFVAWEELEHWLEADPDHLARYQHLSDADARLDTLLPRNSPRPLLHDQARPGRPRRRYLGGAAVALAAALIAMISVPLLRSDHRYDLITAPGEQRQLVLAGGTIVRMNGGTKIILDRDNSRFAKIERGEALFEVRHDPARPFTVQLDGAQLVDLGTRFNVLRSATETDVTVSEGAVQYVAAGQQIPLAAGQRLRVNTTDGSAVRSDIAPALVGTWSQGRFVYSNDPLSKVAADLARYAGIPVQVDRDFADEPFTGVVSVTDRKNLAPLAPLFRARVIREGNHWRITRS